MATYQETRTPSPSLGEETTPASLPSTALTRWLFRLRALVFGTFLCMTYWSSVIVIGWLLRWTRQRILRSFWKSSETDKAVSFEEFCTTLEDKELRARPNWLFAENAQARLQAPTVDGHPPGAIRKCFRLITTPVHSLWLNLRLGFTALVCIFLIVGWGCLLMHFGWEFGWLNSFNKGYEQAFVGPGVSLFGVAMFILAMFYIPMARAHMAATGDYRSFFNVRFVWCLVRARPLTHLILAISIALLALPLEILKAAPLFLYDGISAWNQATDAELFQYLQQYYLGCSLLLFITLLITLALSARAYRKSVLRALHTGALTAEDLHPRLHHWLSTLNLIPETAKRRRGLVRVIRGGAGRIYRWSLTTLLILVWFGFIAKVYAGEFLNRHTTVGFLNHPLIQMPCMNSIPSGLEK